tara:strand:+ start:3111 stop:4193 length:1083 start_codon:yes stop_codon:yes gene_type:complete
MKKNRIYQLSFYLIALSMLISCSVEKKTESPRIKSFLKIISPNSNEIIKKGDSILINIISDSKEKSIVKSTLLLNNDTFSFKNTINLSTNNLVRYGSFNLKIRTLFNDGSVENQSKKIFLYPKQKPKELKYEIIKIVPHDRESYTQGLLIDDNKYLIESSGQYGKSFIKKVDIEKDIITQKFMIDKNLFAEGISIYGDKLYMLTWKSNKGLIFNKNTFELIGEFNYSTSTNEGWGLTTIDDNLVMSDGSEKLFFIDPESFKINKHIEVYDNNGKVENINEMEYINDKIYANIYGKDIIVIINHRTGEVENIINLEGLFNKGNYNTNIDVMNGIAYNVENNTILVTGKWWPSMFELKIKLK